MWSFSTVLWSWSDHFGLSVHPQLVCDHFWQFCEVNLTILACLCILSGYVIILNSCVKLTWPFWLVCASTASTWPFLTVVWSWPDHFGLSVHPQPVCGHSWQFCEVDLTILACLCIHSQYVIILDSFVKLTWPFWPVCAYSGGMRSFSMVLWSWSDHFGLSVHPQGVCDYSQQLCEVDLTILACLCIHSKYVIILVNSVKFFHYLFVISEYVIFLIVFMNLTSPFCPVYSSSESIWSFLVLQWSWTECFALSMYSQEVGNNFPTLYSYSICYTCHICL